MPVSGLHIGTGLESGCYVLFCQAYGIRQFFSQSHISSNCGRQCASRAMRVLCLNSRDNQSERGCILREQDIGPFASLQMAAFHQDGTASPG